MKKHLIPILFLLATCVYGQSHLSITPHIGVKNGQIDEYVFIKQPSHTLSHLEWELRTLWYIGADVTLESDRWTLFTGFNAGIPKASGSTYDSDWQNPNNTSMKTNYSYGDNTLNKSFDFNLGASYRFKPFSLLHIAPVCSLDFAFIKMTYDPIEAWYGDTSNTGKSTYVAYTNSEAKHFTASQLGTVEYTQYRFNLWIGCTFIYTPIQRLTIHITPAITPYHFVMAYDLHTSNSGDITYKDLMESYFAAFRIQNSLSYIFNERLSLILSGTLFWTKTIRGISYQKSGSQYITLSGQESGTASKYYDVSLGLKLTLF
ncbi:MAG: omptin family outer membrane protease [Treponema sp.]|nr:omptin family outer membrane protease [Treponema sp.]